MANYTRIAIQQGLMMGRCYSMMQANNLGERRGRGGGCGSGEGERMAVVEAERKKEVERREDEKRGK